MTKIDWNKTSNTIIEINKTFCPHCGEVFFEIHDSELVSCPFCETSFYGQDISWDEQVYVRIYVDNKTGELKVYGIDSDD